MQMLKAECRVGKGTLVALGRMRPLKLLRDHLQLESL